MSNLLVNIRVWDFHFTLGPHGLGFERNPYWTERIAAGTMKRPFFVYAFFGLVK